MRRTVGAGIVLAAISGLALMGTAGTMPLQAQQKPHSGTPLPKLTVEQVMQRFIEATGGRAVYDKLTSSVNRGTVELVPQGLKGTFEISTQAPNMYSAIINLAGMGEIRAGYDGKVAWSKDPFSGLRTLDGIELANQRREATFNGPLHWKELYKSAEVIGIKKVEDRNTYAVRLIPAEGKPITQYYDAQTFLLVRQDQVQEGPSGTIPVEVTMSDYRIVNGLKQPFMMRQKMGPATLVFKATEIKPNVSVDPSLFTKPADGQKPDPAQGAGKQ
jgi:hypothetical protein